MKLFFNIWKKNNEKLLTFSRALLSDEFSQIKTKMSKTIQQRLKDSLILDENEPILSFIQVADYLKHQQQFKKIPKEEIASLLTKDKSYYLLASSKYEMYFFLLCNFYIYIRFFKKFERPTMIQLRSSIWSNSTRKIASLNWSLAGVWAKFKWSTKWTRAPNIKTQADKFQPTSCTSSSWASKMRRLALVGRRRRTQTSSVSFYGYAINNTTEKTF
jgi:hypothetical protein